MQGDSLVLAGKSIVIDIVLESAQLEGDGPSTSRVQDGTIKLVKVSVSHATADGETKKSDCILQVLQARIEAILAIWNGDGQSGESRELRLARAVTALKLELEDIVFLDGLTAEGSRDWLSDVDGMHRGLARLVDVSSGSERFVRNSTELTSVSVCTQPRHQRFCQRSICCPCRLLHLAFSSVPSRLLSLRLPLWMNRQLQRQTLNGTDGQSIYHLVLLSAPPSFLANHRRHLRLSTNDLQYKI